MMEKKTIAGAISLQEAVQYLQAALPETDLAQTGKDMLERIAQYALETRRNIPWGQGIPDDIFKAYVLFPRVNNEYLEFYQERIGKELLPRVRSLSMEQAVLEVNYWCYEQATYRSTNLRTASPLAVINAGYGRCGEESTLAVSAMRSAGIPARQVYVPRWVHCDDNHAWIEVWVDGGWHYMGACEPEPVLDSGWFTAAASKSMMVHTRCYGQVPQDERVECADERSSVINRTAAYAPTTLLTVRVTNAGQPVAGAAVLFELCNESAFFCVCEKTTGADGCTELVTGLGDLRVKAMQDGRYACRKVDLRRETNVVLPMEEAVPFEYAPEAFTLTPPIESRVQPTFLPGKTLKRHQERMRRAEQARLSRLAAWRNAGEYGEQALGNGDEVRAFLEDDRFEASDKRLLLNTLQEKDFFDITRDVLADALISALPYRGAHPKEIWRDNVLCPRISWEKLLPTRQTLREILADRKISGGREAWAYVRSAVRVKPSVLTNVYPDAVTAIRRGFTSEVGRDVLFVAVCRCLGIPARLNPVTGEKEFYEGGAFVSVDPHAAENAEIVLKNNTGATLQYGERFTLARVENGRERTLRLRGKSLDQELRIPVRGGQYHMVCVTRQIDGSVDGVIIPVTVPANGRAHVDVAPPADATREKLLRAKLPPLKVVREDGTSEELSTQSLSGHAAIIVSLEPGEEPTEHFLNELYDRRADIAARGLRLLMLVNDPAKRNHERLIRVVETVAGAEVFTCTEITALKEWRLLMHCGDMRKPFSIAVDGNGRGLFAFANYNVGAVEALMRIFEHAV